MTTPTIDPDTGKPAECQSCGAEFLTWKNKYHIGFHECRSCHERAARIDRMLIDQGLLEGPCGYFLTPDLCRMADLVDEGCPLKRAVQYVRYVPADEQRTSHGAPGSCSHSKA